MGRWFMKESITCPIGSSNILCLEVNPSAYSLFKQMLHPLKSYTSGFQSVSPRTAEVPYLLGAC